MSPRNPPNPVSVEPGPAHGIDYRQSLVFSWLRRHSLLTDLAVAGITVAVAVSLADELGVATALALGMGVIIITNLILGFGSPRD